MNKWVNANYGIVRSVSHDRTQIRINAPRGGSFECRNEGFEVGQAVCFLLDSLNRQIIKVLPKEVADMQFLMGLNPELQQALQDKPETDESEILDDVALMEEITDGKIHGITGEGRSIEEYLDILSGTTGEFVEGWDDTDWPGNQE